MHMHSHDMPNTIYLCAPVNALVEGIYEENIPVGELRRHGDFGLGTFDDLDGELVMLDGHIYQITADGNAREVNDAELTPFASVTFFKPVRHASLTHELDYDEFAVWLNGLLPSPNIFYALRIEGEFAHIEARSVPKQENYRPLVDAAHDQKLFNFENVAGTLAGFYTPAFMSSLSVPGLHLHYLSADRKKGGHVLSCRPRRVQVALQLLPDLELTLPMTEDYLHLDFTRDTSHDLDEVE